jgi:hypothetical protein
VTVFVGVPMWPFGRMVMCHMVADTPGELNDMAVKIGVNLIWAQGEPDKPGRIGDLYHFDVAKSKRALALKHGAGPLDDIYSEAEVLERLAGKRDGLTGRKRANAD